MKKIKCLLLFIFISMFVFYPKLYAQAGGSYIRGTSLTYNCIGGNEYEVKLKVLHRGCPALVNNISRSYILKDTCANSTVNRSLTLLEYDYWDITCPSACNQCTESNCTDPVLVEYTYLDTITLDTTSCCGFILAFYENRRPTGDFANPTEGYYMESYLNQCLKPCHNSVEFKNKFSNIIIGGSTFPPLDFGSIITAEDSTVFVTTNAMINESTTYDYNSLGISHQNPFNATFYEIDTLTGIYNYMFNVNSFQGRPLVIAAKQYKNGLLYSKIKQEALFNRYSVGGGAAPWLMGFDSTNQYETVFCEGDSNCLFIYSSKSPDLDSTFLEWHTDLPLSAQISLIKGRNEALMLCWKPQPNEVSKKPYYLNVNVRDNICLFNMQSNSSYLIHTLNDSLLKDQIHIFDTCNLFSLQAQLSEQTAPRAYNFSWMLDTLEIDTTLNTQIYLSEAGEYPLSFSYSLTSGCRFTIYDTIYLPYDELKVSLPSSSEVCTGDSITLIPQTSGGRGQINFNWSNGQQSDTLTIAPASSNYIFLEVNDSANCHAKDSVFVIVHQLPQPNAGSQHFMCENGGTVLLEGSPSGGTWQGTAIVNNQYFDPNISGPGSFELIYIYTDSNNCSAQDTVIYEVSPIPTVNAGDDFEVCTDAERVELTPSPPGGAWSGTAIINNSEFDPDAGGSGTFSLVYTITDGFGCIVHDTITATVYEYTQAEITTDKLLLCTEEILALQATPTGGEWSDSGVFEESGMHFFSSEIPGNYTLIYNNPQALCFIPDSIHLTVKIKPDAYFTLQPDSGEAPLEVNFQNQSTSDEELEFYWYFGTAHSSDISVDENPVFTYTDTGSFVPYLVITGKETLCKDTFYYEPKVWVYEKSTGIETISSGVNLIRIYPNPTENVLIVTIEPGNKGTLLTVSDVNGRMLKEKNVKSGNTYNINTKHWVAGSYIIHLYDASQNILYKEVILK